MQQQKRLYPLSAILLLACSVAACAPKATSTLDPPIAPSMDQAALMEQAPPTSNAQKNDDLYKMTGVWRVSINQKTCMARLGVENQGRHYNFLSANCTNWKDTPIQWDLTDGNIVLFNTSGQEIATLKEINTQDYSGRSHNGERLRIWRISQH